MVSRKRQRSADPEAEPEPVPEPDDRRKGHETTASKDTSPSLVQMKRAGVATTIVATLLASGGISPPVVAAAEENLLHPGAAAAVAQPLRQASASNSAAHAATQFSTCRDDATYTSPTGLSCLDHRQYGCQKSGIEALGYDIEATAELLANCPKSCGVPPCETDQDYDLLRNEEWPQQEEEAQEEEIAVSAHRSLLNSDDGDGADSSSSRPIAAQSTSSNVSNLRGNINGGGSDHPFVRLPHGVSSCHAGWHPFCQDDPSYTSKTGLPCEFHSSFDCSSWTKVGYTEMEVYDLINSCPCACAVPCG